MSIIYKLTINQDAYRTQANGDSYYYSDWTNAHNAMRSQAAKLGYIISQHKFGEQEQFYFDKTDEDIRKDFDNNGIYESFYCQIQEIILDEEI